MKRSSGRAGPGAGRIKDRRQLRSRGEPGLAEFRRALVGRRYEPVAVAAFSVLVLFSFWFLVSRAHVVVRGDQYAVNGSAAITALGAEARSAACALRGSARDIAGTARNRFAAAVGTIGARPAPATGAPIVKVAAGEESRPVRSARLAGGAHVARLMAGRQISARTRIAMVGERVSAAQPAYQASVIERISDWLLYGFPQQLSDECEKAYYELSGLFVGRIELGSSSGLRMEAENWMDWLLGLLDLTGPGAGFSLAVPSDILHGSSGVDLAVVGTGVVFTAMLLMSLVVQLGSGLRGSSGMRRRRAGGIA